MWIDLCDLDGWKIDDDGHRGTRDVVPIVMDGGCASGCSNLRWWPRDASSRAHSGKFLDFIDEDLTNVGAVRKRGDVDSNVRCRR